MVYHSQYLNFFERARTEWLRSRGVHQAQLAEQEGILFAIRRMEVDWRLPARLDDVLDVSVHSVQAGRSKLIFNQEMTRSAGKEHLASAVVIAACLDAESFKPTRIPDWIRAETEHVD